MLTTLPDWKVVTVTFFVSIFGVVVTLGEGVAFFVVTLATDFAAVVVVLRVRLLRGVVDLAGVAVVDLTGIKFIHSFDSLNIHGFECQWEKCVPLIQLVSRSQIPAGIQLSNCHTVSPYVVKMVYIMNNTGVFLMLYEIISDNVDFMFTDVEEIGTSDVSICVNRIIKEYAPFTEDYASTPTRQVIRRMVNNCLATLNDLHHTQVWEDMARQTCEFTASGAC